MSKDRLVDPIHFFDERGRSALSYAEQDKEIARLRKQNDLLWRMVKRLRGRVVEGEPNEQRPETRH